MSYLKNIIDYLTSSKQILEIIRDGKITIPEKVLKKEFRSYLEHRHNIILNDISLFDKSINLDAVYKSYAVITEISFEKFKLTPSDRYCIISVIKPPDIVSEKVFDLVLLGFIGYFLYKIFNFDFIFPKDFKGIIKESWKICIDLRNLNHLYKWLEFEVPLKSISFNQMFQFDHINILTDKLELELSSESILRQEELYKR